MTGAFLYLSFCAFKNRIRARVRRLREPRYLIGLIVGGAYIYFFVFARAFRGSTPRRPNGPASPLAALARIAPWIQFVGSFALFVFAALVWLWPGARQPIEFTRAEVQFLFTAPLTRRELLHYKLLRSQLGLLFGSAIATIILRPASFFRGWTFFVGIWILLSVWRFYSIGVALSRESIARHGRSAVGRQWVPVAVVIAAVTALVVPVARLWSTLVQLSPQQVAHAIRDAWSTGAARIVLWPFAAFVRLSMSASAHEFLMALPAALGLLALTYVWVLRADTAFEEASADQAERRAGLGELHQLDRAS